MPQVILPSIRDTDNPELKYQYLYDAYVKLQKELSFLLGNLDSDNVVEAQSVIADWVYAGTVTTDQLIAGEAKIGTALIEDLVVGGNVAMGPNATISWSKVTNQPSIPVLPSYIKSTYIDSTTVQSPTIVGGTITGGSITSNSIINVTTDLKVGNNITIGDSPAYDKSIIFYGIGSISALGDTIAIGGTLGTWIESVYFGRSNVNFSGVSVSGLNYASINHNHGNDYVKSHTGQNLSLVATDSGIAVRVNGVTLGSIFYD